MKRWIVETQAVVRRRYHVEAETEKEAIAASVETSIHDETEVSEETIAVWSDDDK